MYNKTFPFVITKYILSYQCMHFDTNFMSSSEHEPFCLILTYFADFVYLNEKLEFKIDINISSFVCVFKSVIFPGAGDEAISEYKSVIYYQVKQPRWFETVKVHKLLQ